MPNTFIGQGFIKMKKSPSFMGVEDVSQSDLANDPKARKSLEDMKKFMEATSNNQNKRENVSFIGEKVLITMNECFIAPDGKYYEAVFGTVKDCLSKQELLGLKPEQDSMNDLCLFIGNMVISVSQIKSMIKTDKCHFGVIYETTYEMGHRLVNNQRDSRIYNANIDEDDTFK